MSIKQLANKMKVKIAVIKQKCSKEKKPKVCWHKSMNELINERIKNLSIECFLRTKKRIRMRQTNNMPNKIHVLVTIWASIEKKGLINPNAASGFHSVACNRSKPSMYLGLCG